MPRFFVDVNDINKENMTARLTGDDARHIARSLRMAVGDALTVCDGCATEFDARLTKIRDEECELELLCERRSTTEPTVEITLFMAYPKGDKLEVVVQKAVELGCLHIVPFISERCIKRPTDEKKDKQTARLVKIAHEAAKQCGRGRLPSVSSPLSFSEMLDKIPLYDLTLFCYEGEGTEPIKAVLEQNKNAKEIAVIVGAEGGFAELEAEKITERGAKPTGLGKRILRCETAPTACLSMIMYAFEM